MLDLLMRESVIRVSLMDLEEIPFTIGEEREWYYQEDDETDGDGYDSNEAYCDVCDAYYCSCGSCECECVECDNCGGRYATWTVCDCS